MTNVTRSRATTVWIPAATVLLVAALIGGATFALGSAHRPESSRGRATTSEERQQGAGVVAVTAVPGLSDDLRERIARSDIVLTPSSRSSSTVPYAVALAASSAFTRGLGGTVPSGAELFNVTVRNYGVEGEPDARKPSKLMPKIENRPAWVTVFEGVAARASAGAYEEDPQRRAAAEEFMANLKATVVVIVDAKTGEFLTAETI